ncbi:ABC transporter permease subunit [Micromonospora halophytica]|uniref:ABC-2 family transporter protein n=1 Tax=Micromonospora halophytica TaxID=47864 RepID=A0A1C5GVF4_9ACTN|nr:ABC transporter permease subunit [Micromonospora halophytica]SCG37779.1 ABC-2 family transporter protein [Micromonospora halophytica]
MSALTEPTRATGRRAAEPAARFRDLLAAEWIKLSSLRSTYGSLVLIAVSAALFSVRAALADHHNWPDYPAERRAAFDPIHDAFPEEGWLFIILAAGVVGAVTIAGEYASGQIRTTFAAVPARRAVMAAKVVVLAAVMLVVGVLAAGVSFALSQAILADRGVGASLGDPGALRAVAASVLLLPVCALIGLGFGALLRHTAPAIVTTTTVLLLLPLAFDTRNRWTAAIHNALPVPAWERLVSNPFIEFNEHLATIPGSWVVLAAWPVFAALVAMAVVHRREP